MKRKPKGILGDVFAPRPHTVQEIRVLKTASTIKYRNSPAGRVNAAIKEIGNYVMVSNHSVPTKIANLKVDLAETKNPIIKKALEKAIAKLEK